MADEDRRRDGASAGPHRLGGLGEVGGIPDLLDTLAIRTGRLVEALRAEGFAVLRAPTALPGWTGTEIACHLRYGAASTLRMTLAALHGEPTSRYPAGRPRQRPGTLVPRPDEDGPTLVSSLAATAVALERVWRDLRPAGWAQPVRPAAAEDPRDLTVHSLLVLHLTEVEVHGTDLGAGLPDWSPGLVAAALPFRLGRLAGRWPAVPVDASWALDVEAGPTWVVHARAGVASAAPVDGPLPPVDAVIAGSARDVLSLLLGRHDWGSLEVDGDARVGRDFARAFPGP